MTFRDKNTYSDNTKAYCPKYINTKLVIYYVLTYILVFLNYTMSQLIHVIDNLQVPVLL